MVFESAILSVICEIKFFTHLLAIRTVLYKSKSHCKQFFHPQSPTLTIHARLHEYLISNYVLY